MTFEVQHNDPNSSARTGLIQTDHGPIKTPIFMPVGTVGSVKGVHFAELRGEGTDYSGQHLPPVSASWAGHSAQGGWTAQVQHVGPSHPYRFWRFSGILADGHPQVEGRGL